MVKDDDQGERLRKNVAYGCPISIVYKLIRVSSLMFRYLIFIVRSEFYCM